MSAVSSSRHGLSRCISELLFPSLRLPARAREGKSRKGRCTRRVTEEKGGLARRTCNHSLGTQFQQSRSERRSYCPRSPCFPGRRLPVLAHHCWARCADLSSGHQAHFIHIPYVSKIPNRPTEGSNRGPLSIRDAHTHILPDMIRIRSIIRSIGVLQLSPPSSSWAVFGPRQGMVLFLTRTLCVKYGPLRHLPEASTMEYIAGNRYIEKSLDPSSMAQGIEDGEATPDLFRRLEAGCLGRAYSYRNIHSLRSDALVQSSLYYLAPICPYPFHPLQAA